MNFVNILKRAVAFCLAFILTLGLAPALDLGGPTPSFAPIAVAAAPLARDGFSMTPTEFGATGVCVDSMFILSVHYATGTELSMDYSIYIENQPPPAVTVMGGGERLIIPAHPLSSNSVYIFTLKRADLPDITWAFQTAVHFDIIATLPSHTATHVPVDTGIEIEFSVNPGSIENYFSIYPFVAGRFISRGSTAIFMPTNPLLAGQIYTVTIAAGGLLESDISFQFETAPESAQQQNWNAWVHMPERIEFPTFEAPTFNFWVSHDHRAPRPDVNFTLYSLGARDAAIERVLTHVSVPHWAHFTRQNRLIDTAGLQRINDIQITHTHEDWQDFAHFSAPLPAGFYLVNAETGGFVGQMILQITDIVTQVVADDEMMLLWVHDMNTGRPAAGGTAAGAAIDPSGIAIINHHDENWLLVNYNGMESVVFLPTYHFGFPPFPVMPRLHGSMHWGFGSAGNDDYWSVLQLDRSLFQRSDTVNFWGFVQRREAGAAVRHIEATITTWGGVMHRQSFPVTNGMFAGEISLPHLDPGSYSLHIYLDNQILTSTWFVVEDFVKPPYQMLVTRDVNAVFLGEQVNFNVRTEFFEGTPVPELAIEYNFWGGRDRRGHGRTDAQGNFSVSATTTRPSHQTQGDFAVTLQARATLPEIGMVFEQDSVRVFINDINVNSRAHRSGADATLLVNIHNITLDRLNDGTSRHFGDFLCSPVAAQTVSAAVYRVYFVPERVGERYDFVERRVVPRYRFNRREQRIDSFTLITNADGEIEHNFTVPNVERESYKVRISTVDGNGRTITHTNFIGRDWTQFHWDAEDNQIHLYGALPWGEFYDIGDAVELTVKRGLEPIERGNVLFVVVHNGIIYHQVGSNSLNFTFDEKHLPNVTVQAVHFNGHVYYSGWQMQRRLVFNLESRQMGISITTDRDGYRPGDMATVTVQTTDAHGNPKPAAVNIALVDEALFALRDYNVNTLSALYRQINARLNVHFATHRGFLSDGRDDVFMSTGGAMAATNTAWAADMAPAAAEMEPMMLRQALTSEETHLREIFEDTAVFLSGQTGADGTATFTFRLPDNITSWRVTASAISHDFYAGNAVENLIVTQPMFLHYSLGSIFLVGDAPMIGLNAFGTSFTGAESITFDVWRYSETADVRTITAAPFERVNLPIWTKDAEGADSIIIHATASNGYTDALSHNFTVIESHRTVDTSVFYEVTANTVFDIPNQGMANITFTDLGRGQFLHELLGLRHVRGTRIDGQIVRREANRLIAENFPYIGLNNIQDFEPADFQRGDGGMAIFPYADSNLGLTVRLIPFIANEVNTAALANYLWGILEGNSAENRMLALYGLALLRQPVLLTLERYAMLPNLSIRNLAYIALGFAALGETHRAANIYTERVLPHIQPLGGYYRVYTGTHHRDIINATSIVSLLATKLGMPERAGLHAYSMRHHTEDLTVNIERISFIAHEIGRVDGTQASITYTLFGNEYTIDLSSWGHTLRIPAQSMHLFGITSVTGEVGAVSVHRIPLEDIDPIETGITITRRFFPASSSTPATTFNQGDLVRVEITINYSALDIQGTYKITDFLPAGLAHVPNSQRFMETGRTSGWTWTAAEGQRVTFFDHNSRFNNNRTYRYYARVVSPGTFTAQGTIVQNLSVRDYLTIGEDAQITILP